MPLSGTAYFVPYSCTYPSSSTQCTASQRYSIHTPALTGPWWIRSSAGCSCSTAQPYLGPIG